MNFNQNYIILDLVCSQHVIICHVISSYFLLMSLLHTMPIIPKCANIGAVFLPTVQPSKSPQASPFFFVEKKDTKKLQPCQDYQYLNEFTKPNAYLQLLITDPMITLKGSKYFTKLDIRWGYNNVRIKEGNEWKAAFITNKGLFEPTVMFFGLRNSPATFQAMMDDYFRDMIDEGWIAIYMDDILIHAKTKEELQEKTK